MDWATSDHRPPARKDPPNPKLLERCWTMRSVHTGKVLSCGIYETAAPGVEVRCGFTEDDVLMTQLAVTIDAAREYAAEWKRRVEGKGGFEELV